MTACSPMRSPLRVCCMGASHLLHGTPSVRRVCCTALHCAQRLARAVQPWRGPLHTVTKLAPLPSSHPRRPPPSARRPPATPRSATWAAICWCSTGRATAPSPARRVATCSEPSACHFAMADPRPVAACARLHPPHPRAPLPHAARLPRVAPLASGLQPRHPRDVLQGLPGDRQLQRLGRLHQQGGARGAALERRRPGRARPGRGRAAAGRGAGGARVGPACALLRCG